MKRWVAAAAVLAIAPGAAAAHGGASHATALKAATARATPAQLAKARASPACRIARSAATARAEKRLRRSETATIGGEHARRHALARAESRRAACLPPPKRPARTHEAGPPQAKGSWSPPFDLPGVPIHSVLMPNGRVLFFHANPIWGDGPARAVVWNPVTGEAHRVDPPIASPPSNIWCAGQTLLADGRVLVVGGNLQYETAPGTPGGSFKGLNQIWLFDPVDESWTRGPDMAHGRWYPTVTTLADGRALITAGWDETGNGADANNQDVEVYTPAADGKGPGTLQTVGHEDIVYYPHQFVLPDGRVLLAGPRDVDSWIWNPAAGWAVQNVPDLTHRHEYGQSSAVLLPGAPSGSWRVQIFGGSNGGVADTSTAVTEMFDASDPSAGWSPRAPLTEARRNINAPILPDGRILIVGGNETGSFGGYRYEPLMYDPGANSYTRMADQNVGRGYHSTALLLPDGRVWSAGDDTDGPGAGGREGGGGPNVDRAEIFSPPYLFQDGGARPAITSAPSSVRWGDVFSVGTSAGASRLVLMAPGAVTHGNDMHQRHVELAVSPAAGGLVATAPPSGGVAPPGWYMLFALDAGGVPSTAGWIHVGPDLVPPFGSSPPTAAPDPPGGGAQGTPDPPVARKRVAVRVLSPRARLSGRTLRVTLTLRAGGRAKVTARLTRAGIPARRAARAKRVTVAFARAGQRRTVKLAVMMPARWRAVGLSLRLVVRDDDGVRTVTRKLTVKRARTPKVLLPR
ncbi:MAG: galactose oxidase-like domain-containing protein [Thermoleophilia bacterium]